MSRRDRAALYRDLGAAKRQMDKLYTDMAKLLEELLLDACFQNTVLFVGGEEYSHPVLRTFENMIDLHGYNALPTVRHDVLNGQPTTKYTW